MCIIVCLINYHKFCHLLIIIIESVRMYVEKILKIIITCLFFLRTICLGFIDLDESLIVYARCVQPAARGPNPARENVPTGP